MSSPERWSSPVLTSLDLTRALTSFRPPPDAQQLQAIEPPASTSLFIVAGPGTGKTASLTLRILKLVLIDGIPPRGILATTFTNKAAEELRSRILGWGFRILDFLASDMSLSSKQRRFVDAIDINQVRTGTVDSLCEQLLRDFRAPGTQPPVLVDDFVGNTLMLREGIFGSRRDQDTALHAFLLDLYSDNGSTYGYFAGAKAKLMKSIWERRFQDQVSWPQFLRSGPAATRPARQVVDKGLEAYEASLRSAGLLDFSLLENEALQRVRSGQLKEFTDQLRVVLVDEYQDTNLLQEQLYFELAAACSGALVVVGDDDQSLYRFRGATVDLFRDFPSRYQSRFGALPETVFLANNYRSSRPIVSLVNSYATLDSSYQTVRVAGKPVLAHGPNAPADPPVFAMFRSTIPDLARDLGQLIHSVFRGAGFAVPGGRISRSRSGGDVGDCALLCSSPAEYSAGGKQRLPLLLRQELAALRPPIEVFNPRGEDVATVDVVERFGGLLLECLDAGGVVEAQMRMSQSARVVFARWRQRAIGFATGPGAPKGLLAYAQGWADRNPGRAQHRWPESTTAIELVYGLVHYMPELHDDPEGQVYLELFTRQLGACQQVGKFGGRILTDPSNQGLSDSSVRELLRDFLAPIAEGVTGVNEELMETFPRDRLSVLSIHQSKGLEFPFVIVDVGSDFGTNAAGHRFKRYPANGGPPHRMEDLLRAASALGVPLRSQTDRAFDDLYRQFFVAFSRPQDVLLLVGVTPTQPGGTVRNVATGWDRTGTCHWSSTLPFVMI